MDYLHTMVRVTDIDASLKFYCEGLGLKEMRRVDNEKGRFTLVFLATADDLKRSGLKGDEYPLIADRWRKYHRRDTPNGRNYGCCHNLLPLHFQLANYR